jgi:molybdopterin adenylyltransferase
MRIALLTISDRSSRGERPDTSGKALADQVLEMGWEVSQTAIIPDELDQIRTTLMRWADSHSADIILTTGGTGFSPRDVTPEATTAVIERPTPGLAEAMRASSLRFTPHAMLSRAVTGIRGQTLIINLPGSPTGAVENLQVLLPVLPHAVELLAGSPHAEQGHKLAG